MADGGEIAFVLGILEFYLFFGQPVPINRADQLLIFFEQSLPEFLSFLIVHCVNPLSVLRNPHGSDCLALGVYA